MSSVPSVVQTLRFVQIQPFQNTFNHGRHRTHGSGNTEKTKSDSISQLRRRFFDFSFLLSVFAFFPCLPCLPWFKIFDSFKTIIQEIPSTTEGTEHTEGETRKKQKPIQFLNHAVGSSTSPSYLPSSHFSVSSVPSVVQTLRFLHNSSRHTFNHGRGNTKKNQILDGSPELAEQCLICTPISVFAFFRVFRAFRGSKYSIY